MQVSYWQEVLQAQLLSYVSPVLIFGGTTGCALSALTLRNKKFRRSSLTFVLTALAFSDAATLNTGLMHWWIVYQFGVEIRGLSSFGCKVHVMLTYFFGDLSSWTLIMLTVERTVSVCLPLRCRTLFSLRRVVGVWSAVVVLLIGLNAHIFVTADIILEASSSSVNNQTVNVSVCDVKPQYFNFITVTWYWIDAMTNSFVPFGVVLIGNIIVIFKIVIARRARSDQMGVVADARNGGDGDRGRMASTIMTLFTVSAAFLVFEVPYACYFLWSSYSGYDTTTGVGAAVADLAYAVTALLYYTNNAVNFALYFVSGRKFRATFVDTIRCRPADSSEAVTSHTTVTTQKNIGSSMADIAAATAKVVAESRM